MTSLLFKLINGSKYGGSMDSTGSSRDRSDNVMYIQEPVGFVFFTESNIQGILAGLRAAHPQINFSDVQDTMLTEYYKSGSRRAFPVDHDDTPTIRKRVNMLSLATIREVNRRLGNNLNLQKQYELLLRFPNRVGPLPGREDVYSTETSHRFFTDPPPSKHVYAAMPKAPKVQHPHDVQLNGGSWSMSSVLSKVWNYF